MGRARHTEGASSSVSWARCGLCVHWTVTAWCSDCLVPLTSLGASPHQQRGPLFGGKPSAVRAAVLAMLCYGVGRPGLCVSLVMRSAHTAAWQQGSAVTADFVLGVAQVLQRVSDIGLRGLV